MRLVLTISILASVGGLAVFVGLYLEKLGTKESSSNITDFRRSKHVAAIGEQLVRWGVFAEMLIGIAVAIWEGWETMETKAKIAAADPRNQPLKSIAAFVTIDFKTNTVESNSWDAVKVHLKDLPASLSLRGLSNGVGFTLISDKPVSWAFEHLTVNGGGNGMPPDSFTYVEHFSWVPTAREFEKRKDWMKPSKQTNEFNGNSVDSISEFNISTILFGYKAEVVGGSVELLFNDSIRRELPIPPQRVDNFREVRSNPDPFEQQRLGADEAFWLDANGEIKNEPTAQLPKPIPPK